MSEASFFGHDPDVPCILKCDMSGGNIRLAEHPCVDLGIGRDGGNKNEKKDESIFFDRHDQTPRLCFLLYFYILSGHFGCLGMLLPGLLHTFFVTDKFSFTKKFPVNFFLSPVLFRMEGIERRGP
jgi:hypothetical protein